VFFAETFGSHDSRENQFKAVNRLLLAVSGCRRYLLQIGTSGW
jgi:hypothetical protein